MSERPFSSLVVGWGGWEVWLGSRGGARWQGEPVEEFVQRMEPKQPAKVRLRFTRGACAERGRRTACKALIELWQMKCQGELEENGTNAKMSLRFRKGNQQNGTRRDKSLGCLKGQSSPWWYILRGNDVLFSSWRCVLYNVKWMGGKWP